MIIMVIMTNADITCINSNINHDSDDHCVVLNDHHFNQDVIPTITEQQEREEKDEEKEQQQQEMPLDYDLSHRQQESDESKESEESEEEDEQIAVCRFEKLFLSPCMSTCKKRIL